MHSQGLTLHTMFYPRPWLGGPELYLCLGDNLEKTPISQL
jgi:hypothetical protein